MGVAWACLFLVLAFCPTISALGAIVCPGGSTLQGIDVSEFEGTVDWSQVAASGRAFAFARVSDGVDFVDPKFASNYAAIKAAGMIRGSYQFFEPAQDPVAQANVVLANIGTLGAGDLPPVLDVEITGGQSAATIVAGIHSWASTIQAAIGRAPIIYTSAGFWDASVASTDFSAFPLWAANFGVTCPDTPSAWSTWAFWQYSDSGSVPGVITSVDLNKFNGSLSDLQALASPASAPTPTGVVSRKVDGAAGTFDLTLSIVPTNPTTEPRTGPTNIIVFTFAGAVTAATATITEGVATAGAPTFSGNDVIVGITGVADQQYVTIALSNVATGGGAGSGAVRIGFLRGDVNGNRVVTVADLGQVNSQLAQFVTQANFLKDVNASGTLTVADKGITNANLTHNLPAP